MKATPPQLAAARPRLGGLVGLVGLVVLLVGAAFVGAGCSEDGNPLAPYAGQRPLDLLRVTQSFTPEIQWVGGRVAAVGVNRGTRAALDSTLVWARTAPGNDISSFVTVGERTDASFVIAHGGTPQDRLADGETYTFWLAEQSALDVGLDSTRMDPAAFADTTLAVRLIFCGQQGGGLDVEFEIERDERLTGERLLVRWTPEVAFRQLAIREAPTGGFQGLIWHVVSPEDGPPLIESPVTIGTTPAGAEVAIPFTDFVRDNDPNPPEEQGDPELDVDPPTYTLWATTDDWNESFAPSAPGYAFFRILKNNFDIDEPCP